jgi:hypothetical protein
MKFKKNFNEYLKRAYNLLQFDDEVNLTYCALELRRAIELIIWTQFKDAFGRIISKSGMYQFDYPFKLQNQSISKMYKLLNKHIRDYEKQASQRTVISLFSASGSNPFKKDGDICYIPSELPTSDYHYLSLILHYEKELDPKKFNPDKNKLLAIYERLKFVKENYTIRGLVAGKEVDDIVKNIKKEFKISDEKFRSFK